MKLIADWKQAVHFLSVQLSAVYAAAVSTWVLLPDDQKSSLLGLLPFEMGGKGPAIAVLVGFLTVILARVKAQPALQPSCDETERTGDTIPMKDLK